TPRIRDRLGCCTVFSSRLEVVGLGHFRAAGSNVLAIDTVGNWCRASLIPALVALVSCASAATQREIAAAESPPPITRGSAPLPPEPEGAAPAVEAPQRSGNASRSDESELLVHVELETVERMALSRHPVLREGASRVRALAQSARAEAALPPPELIAELWQVPLERPYAIDDAGMLMF